MHVWDSCLRWGFFGVFFNTDFYLKFQCVTYINFMFKDTIDTMSATKFGLCEYMNMMPRNTLRCCHVHSVLNLDGQGCFRLGCCNYFCIFLKNMHPQEDICLCMVEKTSLTSWLLLGGGGGTFSPSDSHVLNDWHQQDATDPVIHAEGDCYLLKC